MRYVMLIAILTTACSSDGRPDPNDTEPCEVAGATVCARACLAPQVADQACVTGGGPQPIACPGTVHEFEGVLGCCITVDDGGTQKRAWTECE